MKDIYFPHLDMPSGIYRALEADTKPAPAEILRFHVTSSRPNLQCCSGTSDRLDTIDRTLHQSLTGALYILLAVEGELPGSPQGAKTRLLLASLTAHQCCPMLPASGGEGRRPGHACPFPVLSRRMVRRKLCSQKKSIKPVPGGSGHKDSWPIRDSSRKNKNMGWRVFEGSLAHPTSSMPPGWL
jgi:hypothetical protein